MNEAPIISVILPIYNVEKYLSRCIESILKQTFSDFELLLINDGSPDQCGKICDEWSLKDSRIRVLHQQNTGLSGARNKGIDNARGEYIVFVDPDDFVASDYLFHLQQLMLNAACTGKGFGVQGYNINEENGDLITKISFSPYCYKHPDFEKLFAGSDILRMFPAWAKIYERCFLNHYNIRFDISIRYSEDSVFNLHCMEKCDYMIVGNDVDYIYISYPGTMSKIITPFDSEYHTFTLCKHVIDNILANDPLSNEAIKGIWKTLHYLINRILKADYHRMDSNNASLRRKHLRSLCNNDLNYLKLYYSPDYIIDKIGRKLLIHGHIALYDIFFTSLFYLNIQKMFCPPGSFKKK